MIRLIFSFLFLGLSAGRCDLINTQSAATKLYGIEVSRVQKSKLNPEERVIVVSFDRAKVGEALALVVRDKDYKELGRFEFASQPTGTQKGRAQARFFLDYEYLHRSFLKTHKHIVPLRLFFDEKGRSIDASNKTDIEATSSFSLKVWPVRVSFYKAQYGQTSKNQQDPIPPDAKPVFPQSKTQEELFRSWGLVPPEGTVFYYGGGKAAVVVRSTRGFLDDLESELKKRGFLVEDDK